MRRKRKEEEEEEEEEDDDNCGQTFRTILVNASCWPCFQEWDEFDILPIVHVSSKNKKAKDVS